MIRKFVKNIFPLFSANSFRRLLWYVRRGNFIALFQNMLALIRTNTRSMSSDRLNILESLKCLSVIQQKQDDNSDKYDIIVPVYNGFEFVGRALQSMLENTPHRHRIIIVDDCSTDKRVSGYLDDINRQYPNVTLVRNPQNFGFVRSVNIAAALTSCHFAIVNSDVEVPPDWLQRLMDPILSQKCVGSTTPFTNAGGICSFPVMNSDNIIFDNLDVATIDKCFQKISPQEHYIEIPTGIGFCMGINRQAYETIGMFDEKLFEKGYGEENDWCMRARYCGYRHLLVPNLFVYHKHGGSFSNEEKAMAIGKNLPRLLSKYPEYQGLVNIFCAADPPRRLRNVMLLLLASAAATGTEMVIDHNLGGGASQYRDDLIHKRVVEGWSILLICYEYHTNSYSVIHYYKEYKTEYAITEIRDLLAVTRFISIDRITVNSFVTYRDIKEACDTVLRLQEQSGCKIRALLHDFFPVCPSYNLLKQEGKYCFIPADELCSPCILHHHGDSLFQNYGMEISEWRAIWSNFLQKVDEIVCFSNSSRDILLKAYQELSHDKIVVVPHVVDDLEPVPPRKPAASVVIGVLGSINHAKGLGILKELSRTIDRKNLPFRIVVIGRTSEAIPGKRVSITGGYERKNLPALITKHNIHVIFIPSIWPETFSYTTEEAIQMCMPVAVFNLGAPAERVKDYPLGLIIDSDEPLKILDELQLLARRAGY